jgi:hypothetical protein
MTPAPKPTDAAAGCKRKKPHGPSKTLGKKPANPSSATATATKGKKHKDKKLGQQPTRHAKKPAKPDQTAASAGAAGDDPASNGVLLSAAMPPARQLEFFPAASSTPPRCASRPSSSTHTRVRAPFLPVFEIQMFDSIQHVT